MPEIPSDSPNEYKQLCDKLLSILPGTIKSVLVLVADRLLAYSSSAPDEHTHLSMDQIKELNLQGFIFSRAVSKTHYFFGTWRYILVCGTLHDVLIFPTVESDTRIVVNLKPLGETNARADLLAKIAEEIVRFRQ